MSEPKKIPIEGKNYFAWEYQEQTRIKHKVISYYFNIWVTKLGKYHDTLFMDCHGGCGAYMDSNQIITYGSSIQIDKIATKINASRRHQNYIYVCEKNPQNNKNLREVWADQHCSKLCRIRQCDFNDVLEEPKLKRFYTSHPSLFFIDPFGYDLKMGNMKDLMYHTGSEIIINFMFDHLNRFLSINHLDEQRDAFFGTHEWVNAISLRGEQREKFLVNLYKNKLKQITGAKFVFAYRLCYPGKKQTYYYLVHATNNIQGIVYMKDSFAKINNGRLEYLGRYKDELTIFDMNGFKSTELAQEVLQIFRGQTLTFDKVLENIIEDIPYLQKDLSNALLYLEQEGKIRINRVSSKRGSYKGSDQIYFGV